jgi:PAS domain S-box-containing protein
LIFRLSDLVDIAQIQNLAEVNYKAAGIPTGIIDAESGEILVEVGWQDICVQFHRAHPASAKRCMESDHYIKNRILDGSPYAYKCQNGLWDIGIPILVDGFHLATLFLGQFFYEDESFDRNFFIRQSEQFGYDVPAYLAALDRVPILNREKVSNILDYNVAFAGFIADLAQKKLRFSRELGERKRAEEALQKARDELEFRVQERTAELIRTNEALKTEIAAREQVEEKLRQSQQHLRNILNNVASFVGVLNPDGTLIEVNSTAMDAANLSLEDVLGKPFEECYWWAWSPEVQKQLGETMDRAAHGQASRYDVLNRVGEERFIVVDFMLAPLFGPDGKVAYLIASGVDVTERKQAEQALGEEAIRRRILFEQSKDGIVVLDQHGKVCEANQSFADMLGYTMEEVRQLHVWDWDAQWTREELEEIIRLGDSTGAHFETRHRRKDGTICDVEISANSAMWAGQKLGLCVCRDISQRKAAENALREREEIYSAIVNQAAEGIVLIDAETLRFAEFNEAACSGLGYNRDEFARLTLFDIQGIMTPAQVIERFGTLVKAGRGCFEDKLRCKDGTLRDTRISSRVIRLRDKKYLPVIWHDMTEVRQAEEALRSLPARLLAAQEEERKRIAHELHDSIGGSLGAIQFSLQNILALDQSDVKFSEAVENLTAMVQQARDEARRIYANLRPSMLDDLGVIATIGWFCRQFQEIYGRIRIEQQIQVEEGDIPESLKIVIFRIMQEAFHNIAKYSKADRAHVSLSGENGLIALSIVDNGVGFDVRSAYKSRDDKGGLGLTSMRERVQLSGGVFAIESTIGGGTAVQASWNKSNLT